MSRGRTLNEIRRHYSPEAVAERQAAEADKAKSEESCTETSSTTTIPPLHYNRRSFVNRAPLPPIVQRELDELANKARAARVAQSMTQLSRAAQVTGMSMEEMSRTMQMFNNLSNEIQARIDGSRSKRFSAGNGAHV